MQLAVRTLKISEVLPGLSVPSHGWTRLGAIACCCCDGGGGCLSMMPDAQQLVERRMHDILPPPSRNEVKHLGSTIVTRNKLTSVSGDLSQFFLVLYTDKDKG